jgi:histidine triad (HIT) family protein
MFQTGKELAKKMKDIFSPDKMAFVLAGQGVPHLHLHLIPMNHETDLDPHIAAFVPAEELTEIQKMFN